MKIAMLIAEGPNSVEVPCMFFASMEEGLAFMKERFGLPSLWSLETREYVRMDLPAKSYRWPMNEADMPKLAALFTSYYGGCGDVGALHLELVDSATPLVAWSLD